MTTHWKVSATTVACGYRGYFVECCVDAQYVTCAECRRIIERVVIDAEGRAMEPVKVKRK